MRQKACWRLLLRAVDAATEHVAACGTKQGVLGTVLPNQVQGKPLQLHGSQAFISLRGYAAPLSKVSKPSKKKNESNARLEPEKDDRRINRAIVARNIRLVGEDGRSHEVLTRQEALLRANRAGLDLVEVDGKAEPVVCKLMNYKMEKFKEKKREKDLRKKQVEKRRLDEVKEIRYSFKTEQKDLGIKADMATRMLEHGHRVKVTILLQGKPADADPAEQLQKMINLLEGIAKIEAGPRLDQTRIWVLLRLKSSKQGTHAAGQSREAGERDQKELESDSELDSDGGSRDIHLPEGGDLHEYSDEEDDAGNCTQQPA